MTSYQLCHPAIKVPSTNTRSSSRRTITYPKIRIKNSVQHGDQSLFSGKSCFSFFPFPNHINCIHLYKKLQIRKQYDELMHYLKLRGPSSEENWPHSLHWNGKRNRRWMVWSTQYHIPSMVIKRSRVCCWQGVW